MVLYSKEKGNRNFNVSVAMQKHSLKILESISEIRKANGYYLEPRFYAVTDTLNGYLKCNNENTLLTAISQLTEISEDRPETEKFIQLQIIKLMELVGK